MRAYARVLAPDDTTWLLGPGDLIGRLPSAALPVDDARVSEAHALVSLRGGELKLLGLRGVFAVDGQPRNELTLAPSVEFDLAPGLSFVVLDVELPDAVLAIEGEGVARQILTGSSSIVLTPRPMLVGRYRDDAAAHLWTSGDTWRVRVRGEPARDLQAGDVLSFGEFELRVVAVALARAGVQTRVEGGVVVPLRIIAAYDTVHIHRDGEQPVTLDGISARILSELVALDGPASWEIIAGDVWRDETDRAQLRRKWDVSLARLRRKLRQERIRPDLVRAGGTGQVELLLYAEDVVDDRT